MMDVLTLILDIASWILLVSGACFCVIGGVGVLRLPDFYTRTHAASIPDTLGTMLVLLGLCLQSGLALPELAGLLPADAVIGQGRSLVTAKLLMILALVMLTSPTAGHALVKAAYARGVSWQTPTSTDPDTRGGDAASH